MKASGPGPFYLVANSASSLHKHTDDQSAQLVGCWDGACLYMGAAPPVELLMANEYDTERLLDNYHLFWRRNDAVERGRAERVLFELLADEYDTVIDRDNNLDNLAVLFHLVSRIRGDRPIRVLDFGCGTGLSQLVALRVGVEVVGCDQSMTMRSIAGRRGMAVTTIDELTKNYFDSFDAVIAAYTLHLAIPIDDLVSVFDCMRVGARLAANFHKGMGWERFSTLARISGLRELKLEATLPLCHGRYGFWQKEGVSA